MTHTTLGGEGIGEWIFRENTNICIEMDSVFSASSGMDSEMPWLSSGSDALIVLNTAAQFMKNRKLLFKQMANLPIHNQAFNEIKQSSQGCRCVSPDHFGRHQFNCSSIFVKSVPRCLSYPLFYLPPLFLSFLPSWYLDHNQMDSFLSWLPVP